MARSLRAVAEKAIERLYNHDCATACYRCLKSYRNQMWHRMLDKNLVRDVLFQLSTGEMLGPVQPGKPNDGVKSSETWTASTVGQSLDGSVIEEKLYQAIKLHGRLPLPMKQREFRSGDRLVTIADFAYEDEKIAISTRLWSSHSTATKTLWRSTRRSETNFKRLAGLFSPFGKNNPKVSRSLRRANLGELTRKGNFQSNELYQFILSLGWLRFWLGRPDIVLMRQAKAQLSDHFKSLSFDVLQSNSKTFITLLKASWRRLNCQVKAIWISGKRPSRL